MLEEITKKFPFEKQYIPNYLTFSRVAVLPILVIAFFLPAFIGGWIALIAFLYASVTDFLDGWLARKWHVVSDFGRMLDPIADKLLVALTLFLLAATGYLTGVGIIAALCIISREIFISGLREFVADKAIVLPVTVLAKYKTTLQMVALVILLSGVAMLEARLILFIFGEILLCLAAAVTMITGCQYYKAANISLFS